MQFTFLRIGQNKMLLLVISSIKRFENLYSPSLVVSLTVNNINIQCETKHNLTKILN